ncbi:16S rRNA (cytosine(1402)-N(4))-methyltransferase RsmH [Zwartia sp. IMCC34845]|nr:16S rRNA (cytosine(1402)-N(4))-methyltransferase RsmH [Zwartia vadi]MDN3988767.1 16S rRNA (cytosine(1402)-N(4))-methyltransferase RsmH [Zwartia vadi]
MFSHRPVLLEPTVEALVQPDYGKRASKTSANTDVQTARLSGVFVDATFGRGGHSRLLLEKLSSDAKLFVFDKDPQAIEVAQELAREDSRVMVIHAGFGDMLGALSDLGVSEVDGVMLDLGVSSPQIDDAARGFSFMREGPLDMRMDTTRGETVAQWLALASIDEMREVIVRYGEERFAFQIAKAIAARRATSPLLTTLDLAELVSSTVRTREKGQHPATRTFQALRIYINRELQELESALQATLTLLKTGGRMAVISFHSLEDRVVKQFITAASRPEAAYARLPLRESEMPQPVLLALARVLPSDHEISENPRARSAVLRVAERTATRLPADGAASYMPAPVASSSRHKKGSR